MLSDHVTASVTLKDVDNSDPIPRRTIVLKAPEWEIQVGRGTLNSELNLRPAEDNTYFDSRVMSRHHAILRADPLTRVYFFEST